MGLIRRKRRRNSFRQKTKVNFTSIIVIMSIAVLFGYGTAKFIIYPLFNSDTSENEGFKIEKFLSFFFDEEEQKDNNDSSKNNGNDTNNTTGEGIEQSDPNSQSNIVEDKLEVTPTDQSVATTLKNGYCIQFGSFSTKLSAENLVSELKTSGINAEIIEKDGAYKVISQLFEKKEQAVATMNTLSDSKFTDAFIIQRDEK